MQFFHVQRTVPCIPFEPFVRGQRLTVGTGFNPFFSQFRENAYRINVKTEQDITLQMAPVDYLRAVKAKAPSNPNAIGAALGAVEHLASFVRELIWEDVRRSEFEQLPSRQRCMWVSSSLEEAEKWYGRVNHFGPSQIVGLESDAEPFMADSCHLSHDSEPMVKSIERAKAYWSGVATLAPQWELLLVGEIQITEVIRVEWI